MIYFSDYPHGIHHASFPLRKNGEEIYLTGIGPNGSRYLIDTVTTGRMRDDEALVRLGKEGVWTRSTATPGVANIPRGESFFELLPGRRYARLSIGTEAWKELPD